MVETGLVGREGAWPFVGHFEGGYASASTGGTWFRWCGRVAVGRDLELAWRASRTLDRALKRGGPPDADVRRGLSILWSRLDAVRRDGLGPAGGDDLVMLALAGDAEGVGVCAVGLVELVAVGSRYAASPWVPEGHPLLGRPGFPSRRPGVLTVSDPPEGLFGRAAGSIAVSGFDVESVRGACRGRL